MTSSEIKPAIREKTIKIYGVILSGAGYLDGSEGRHFHRHLDNPLDGHPPRRHHERREEPKQPGERHPQPQLPDQPAHERTSNRTSASVRRTATRTTRRATTPPTESELTTLRAMRTVGANRR